MIIFKALSLSLSIAALMSLSACSANTDNATDDPKAVTKTPVVENVENLKVAVPTVSVVTAPTVKKQDLVTLLGWFEEGCGFGKYMTDSEPVPSALEQRYNEFKQSFMTESYTPNDEHIATITRDYQLPKAYRDSVQDISVEQDDDGVSYIVTFANATYRGYDLDKLQIFYTPNSDYLFDVLYFKNQGFMALKPQFKAIDDMNYDDKRVGVFDAEAKTILCYLGL